MQSPSAEQLAPSSQGGQLPPQSTSVSLPFRLPSEQDVGGGGPASPLTGSQLALVPLWTHWLPKAHGSGGLKTPTAPPHSLTALPLHMAEPFWQATTHTPVSQTSPPSQSTARMQSTQTLRPESQRSPNAVQSLSELQADRHVLATHVCEVSQSPSPRHATQRPALTSHTAPLESPAQSSLVAHPENVTHALSRHSSLSSQSFEKIHSTHWRTAVLQTVRPSVAPAQSRLLTHSLGTEASPLPPSRLVEFGGSLRPSDPPDAELPAPPSPPPCKPPSSDEPQALTPRNSVPVQMTARTRMGVWNFIGFRSDE